MIVHPCGMCAQRPEIRPDGFVYKYRLHCKCPATPESAMFEDAVFGWNALQEQDLKRYEEILENRRKYCDDEE